MAFDPLPYFTVGGIVVAMTVGMFQIKESIKKRSEAQEHRIDEKISSGVDKVIKAIDEKTKVIDERFRTTDTALSNNKGDIEDIEEDVKVLERDFKSLCEKIGKHDYIVDKILPEYIDLKDSIYNFKHKIDENLLSNKDESVTNNEDEYGK